MEKERERVGDISFFRLVERTRSLQASDLAFFTLVYISGLTGVARGHPARFNFNRFIRNTFSILETLWHIFLTKK